LYLFVFKCHREQQRTESYQLFFHLYDQYICYFFVCAVHEKSGAAIKLAIQIYNAYKARWADCEIKLHAAQSAKARKYALRMTHGGRKEQKDA